MNVRHALTQKLAGVAAWKWLAGLTAGILVYRHFQGSSGAPPTTTDASSGLVSNTGGVDFVPIYATPGSDPNAQPLEPAQPTASRPGGGLVPVGETGPGKPTSSTPAPQGKRTRTHHQPHHKAKGHKPKPAHGSHRSATPGRKRAPHAKAHHARGRSDASSHPAAHKQAPKPAHARKRPPRRRKR